VSTPILFSPAKVKSTLASLPSVAALLPDPAVEGEPSEAFPGVLRTTEREVYRWIANTQYEHLAEALGHLERPHAARCRFGNLLTTRSRNQFQSYTAELFVADDLLRRGYAVSTIERTGQASPDLHVTGNGIDLAVEVYSPRELGAVDEWVHRVTDLLNYVDIAASFTSSVGTRYERSIPPQPSHLDPWATAGMLEQTGEHVIAEITHDVEDALRNLRSLNKVYRHPETPLVTTVEVENVEQASPRGPARWGAFSSPGYGGYSPAGVFRTVVERTEKKARKRQTHGVAAQAHALVVYLMGTKIADDLARPVHMSEAEAALDLLEPQHYGLDAIAFVVRMLPTGLGAIFTVADDATLTDSQVEDLFHQSRP
jgi:hypothetical protein